MSQSWAEAFIGDAIDYLMPRTTLGPILEARPHIGADWFINCPEDEAVMLLRDVLFCLKTERETSLQDVENARTGRWRLKKNLRGAGTHGSE